MMQRSIYPPTWEQLAQKTKERDGWMCEVCMVPHSAIVRSLQTGNPYVVYLQAAHVNHDHDNSYLDLKAVCPRCHQLYFGKPKTKRAVPWPCKQLQAIQRRYNRQEATKKLAQQSLQASGASNEMFLSKFQLSSSLSHSNRVQFGWQLEEGRYE